MALPQINRGVSASYLLESRQMSESFRFGLGDAIGHLHVAKSEEELQDLQRLDEDERARLDEREESQALIENLDWWVKSEFDTLAVRLQVNREQLFNEFDRLRSEAELRIGVFVPGTLLVGVASALLHWSASFALVFPVALLVSGVRKQRTADDRVWQSVIYGAIESPTMHAFVTISNEGLQPPIEPMTGV